MEGFDYDKELRQQLSKDVWLRHLYNKLGKEAIVEVNSGTRIVGILKSISYVRGILNIEIVDGTRAYYVNWRHVNFLEVRP